MSIRDEVPQSFPDLRQVVQNDAGDFHLPPLESIVSIRVAQVMDATPLGLGMSEADMTLWGHARAMVEAAYRLGLRDGLARLGDLA